MSSVSGFQFSTREDLPARAVVELDDMAFRMGFDHGLDASTILSRDFKCAGPDTTSFCSSVSPAAS